MSLLHQTVNRVFWTVLLLLFFLGRGTPALCLTLQEEEILAEQFVAYIESSQRLVRDPVITAYIREVGGRIVQTLEAPPFPMTFDVVMSPVYNAFAGPGGHIYIHSGLILAMEREADLAGILGHEIAHVTCRHIAELVNRSRKVGLGALAGMAAGILAALGGASPDAAVGLIMGTQAAGQSAMLSYTRENERQADERGLGYLSAAGYGGEGLLRMLRKIRGQEWYTTDDVPVYLRTHPGTEERIAFVASWLESRSKTLGGVVAADPSDDLRFRHIRNRLLGRYGELEAAVPQLRQALTATPDDLSLRHALALALIRKGEKEEALALMEGVAAEKPMDPLVMADLGRMRYRAGNPDAAIPLLEIMAPETGDPEVFFDLGRAYAAVGRHGDAAAVFDRVIEMAPALIGARYAAGEARGQMGEEGLAHYHLGRYHEALRDLGNADFHYTRSLALLPEGVPERADAKSRLDEVRRGLRSRAAEKR